MKKGRQCSDNKTTATEQKLDPDCKTYGRCRHVGGHEKGRQFDHIDNDNDGKAVVRTLTASKIHGHRTIAKHKLPRIKLDCLFLISFFMIKNLYS